MRCTTLLKHTRFLGTQFTNSVTGYQNGMKRERTREKQNKKKTRTHTQKRSKRERERETHINCNTPPLKKSTDGASKNWELYTVYGNL